ncbi:hypothetical protein HY612_01845 [Candidatus Roizmanbacteria bacterium]|nr:hypothetical protein [Candidatus Roizmanbacteria bacterium]
MAQQSNHKKEKERLSQETEEKSFYIDRFFRKSKEQKKCKLLPEEKNDPAGQKATLILTKEVAKINLSSLFPYFVF